MKNTTITNPVAVLKHSYNLDRILEIENKGQIAMQLIKAMRKDIALKGIKDSPRDEILDDVIKMILKKFQYLTPLEIEVALEMERYGEFETKSNHFQFYGTEYVSEVLGKYINWKIKKATELNLSRESNKIEVAPDYDKINDDYMHMIMLEINTGNKHFRHIQAHLLYDQIPKDELPSKDEAMELYESERKILIKEGEERKKTELDAVKAKQFSEMFVKSFQTKLITRCRNIVTCEWLRNKNLKLF